MKVPSALQSLGVTEDWQILLLAPESCLDLSQVFTCAYQAPINEKSIFQVRVMNVGPVIKDRPSKLQLTVADMYGYTFVATFRATSEVLDKQREQFIAMSSTQENVFIYAKTSVFAGKLYLNLAKLIHKDELKISVKYPSTIKTKSEMVAKCMERFTDNLDLLKKTEEKCSEILKLSPKFLSYVTKKISHGRIDSISHMLKSLHTPKSKEEFYAARQCLGVLAGFKAIQDSRTHVAQDVPRSNLTIAPTVVQSLIKRLPFKSTDEQINCIESILLNLNSNKVSKDLISADVGTGKTSVFSPLAAAASLSKKIAIIIEPNETLAHQVAQNIRAWWPEVKVIEITASTSNNVQKEDVKDCVVVGTTAINFFFEKNGLAPDLIICDEEHKFGTEQKNAFSSEINYIGSTATCIPRTLQLAMLNSYNVHRIKKCHVDKDLRTEIKSKEDTAEMFQEVRKQLESGNQILIVYPIATIKDLEDEPDDVDEIDLVTVEEAIKGEGERESSKLDPMKLSSETNYHVWNGVFPGLVSWIHGNMKSDLKAKEFESFLSREKPILVCTTAIEVGLDSKYARYMIVVHPDRHGLAGLHQLRGRLARAGGVGRMDLFMPIPKEKIKNKVIERLGILTETTDGFEIAEDDLMRRGFGELAVGMSEQSGAMDSFIPSLKITPSQVKMVDELIQEIKRLRSQNADSNSIAKRA